MPLSTSYANAALDDLFGGGTEFKLALRTAGGEVSGNNYARATVTFKTAVDGVVKNNQANFPESSGIWGTIVGYTLYTSGGAEIGRGDISPTLAVDGGQSPKVYADDIEISLTSEAV